MHSAGPRRYNHLLSRHPIPPERIIPTQEILHTLVAVAEPAVLGSLAYDHAYRRIIRGMVHAVRNPLQGVSYAVPILADPAGEAGPPNDTIIDLAVRGTDRTLDALDDLSRLLQMRDQSPAGPASLAGIIDAAVTFAAYVRSAGEFEITSSLDDALPAAHAESRDIITALVFLLTNAADAVPDHESAHAHVTARSVGDQLIIDVMDIGPGVAEEVRDRVFEPGVTTGPHRAGLGLPLARALAQRQGGTLDFVGAVEGRTTFRLAVPSYSASGS